MVWGTYFEKNCPSSNGHVLDVGGEMLAMIIWGTYAVKIEVQMGSCLIVGGSKSFWGTCNHQHGDLTKLLNSVRK